ncbi:acetyltransferase (GNAT) family protein, partial [Tepidamorphus gemmatus]
MLIRLARRNEADELSALVMRAKAHWGYDAAFLEACRDDLRVRSEQIAAGAVWVAELDGMAAGVLELAIADSEAEVRACFVEPHAIGRGVGRALWRHAEALAMAAGASAVRCRHVAQAVFAIRHGAGGVGMCGLCRPRRVG